LVRHSTVSIGLFTCSVPIQLAVSRIWALDCLTQSLSQSSTLLQSQCHKFSALCLTMWQFSFKMDGKAPSKSIGIFTKHYSTLLRNNCRYANAVRCGGNIHAVLLNRRYWLTDLSYPRTLRDGGLMIGTDRLVDVGSWSAMGLSSPSVKQCSHLAIGRLGLLSDK